MTEEKTGTCPVCNGTKRIPATGNYKHVVGGYDKDTDTFPCNNCGGQKQWQAVLGFVPLRPDGTPCTHEYVSHKISNCYHGYTCKHCKDYFTIDSGD
jgi:transposase-like protein